jgi:putative glycosyltransferase (TIGR04372 family)
MKIAHLKYFDLPVVRKILKPFMKVFGVILSAFIIMALWFISPFVKVKVAGLIGQRLGHFAMNTDLYFRRCQLNPEMRKVLPIFIVGSVANRQLLTMWKRHAVIIESRLLRGLFEYSTWLWKKTKFYEPLEMFSNEYREFNQTNKILAFTKEEESKGKSCLKGMGIDPDKHWYVCIFTRDSLYLEKEFGLQKDWSYHDFRDADINTLKLAIDYIVGLGGFVIRMGHHVKKPLDYDHPQVIDYATTSRSDFMDIYLVANCRFFAGSPSGIHDVALIFDRPQLSLHAPPTYPAFGKNCLFIPKKIKSLDGSRYMSYADFIEKTRSRYNGFELYGHEMEARGWVYEENSAEEVLGAVMEMIERLENRFYPTKEDIELLGNYYNLYPKDHKTAQILTPIGRNFLKSNSELFFDKTLIIPNVLEDVV